MHPGMPHCLTHGTYMYLHGTVHKPFELGLKVIASAHYCKDSV